MVSNAKKAMQSVFDEGTRKPLDIQQWKAMLTWVLEAACKVAWESEDIAVWQLRWGSALAPGPPWMGVQVCLQHLSDRSARVPQTDSSPGLPALGRSGEAAALTHTPPCGAESPLTFSMPLACLLPFPWVGMKSSRINSANCL